MSSSTSHQHLGIFKLSQRTDNGIWYISWYDEIAKRTRRRSTGIRGGTQYDPPQSATTALKEQYEFGQRSSDASVPYSLGDIFTHWLENHAIHLRAPERPAYSVMHWLKYLEGRQSAGMTPSPCTAEDLTADFVKGFIDERLKAGISGDTISRDLAALRAALTYAWRHRKIPFAPFVEDVPSHFKTRPIHHVFTATEVAKLIDACGNQLDRQHLIDFILLMLATAGRPNAILEMTRENLDYDNGLIDPSQPGQISSRKRRAIVPMPTLIGERFRQREGKLVVYRTMNRIGDTIISRPTRSVRTGFKSICNEIGIGKAIPKDLRHTMITHLATSRLVTRDERMLFAGHTSQGTTARHYEHLEPDYLRSAVNQVEVFLKEVESLTRVNLRPNFDPVQSPTKGGEHA